MGLDAFMRARCQALFQHHGMIVMREESDDLSTAATFVLSLHYKLWKKLFNIVVDPIVAHMERVLRHKAMKRCKYMFLVGGFSNARYLQQRIQYQFGDRIEI